jgi:hypothetical protein
MPPPTLSNPVVKDNIAWQQAIMEHRRALFERIVIEFPELLKSKKTDIYYWRSKLSGPKTNKSAEAHL